MLPKFLFDCDELPIDTKLTAINSPEFIQRTKKRAVIRLAKQPKPLSVMHSSVETLLSKA